MIIPLNKEKNENNSPYFFKRPCTVFKSDIMKYFLLFVFFGVAQATISTPFSTTWQSPSVCAQLEPGGIGSWTNANEADTLDDIVAHTPVSGISQTLYCTGYNILAPFEGASNINIAVNAYINQNTNLWHWKLYPQMAGESILTNPNPWPAPVSGIQQAIFSSSFNISNSRTEIGIALNVESGSTVWVDTIQMAIDYAMITTIIDVIPDINEIIVQGVGFWDSQNIMCKYSDGQTFTGIYDSPTNIICPLPSLSPGQYTVEIAPNGSQYTNDGVMFEIPTTGGPTGPTTGGPTGSTTEEESATCDVSCIIGITLGVVLVAGLVSTIVFFKMRTPLGGCIEKRIPGRVSGPSERSTLPYQGPPRQMKKNKTHARPASGTTSLNREPSEYLSRNPLNDFV